MGFQRQAYRLTWPEGSRWNGLEVRLRGMDIGELKKISDLRGDATDGNDLERVEPVLDILGSALLSWNLEDDGIPVPTSAFRGEDMTMLLAIVAAWTEVVGDVPTPLPPPSSNGERLEEVLIPMEIPLSSHPNLNTPN